MKNYSTPRALDVVLNALKEKKKEFGRRKYTYYIPSLWMSQKGSPRKIKVDPFDFYIGAIRDTQRRKSNQRIQKGTKVAEAGGWTDGAVIYNMFVRTTTAFDHNGNGKLDLPISAEGFRETGTFLKSIAILPYIRNLGANTVHLLPITSIGHDGKKGTLGSPYAIRNPYELDENLSEPILGLDAKTEFKAFVEAAHDMGLRVVLEFVFRTAAKDSDWVKEHPEWMYWIREEVQARDAQHLDEFKYGSPVFTSEELKRIHELVEDHNFDNLPEPHKVHQEFFAPPPHPDMVWKENGHYVGLLPDGRRVHVPGAFADWPPDDNQPPWGDVTYLRMYEHPAFNYIAYNTIRMYDSRLSQLQYINRPLWERIVGIIPYYQREFRIDGVMIDMGHALPMDLKAEMVNTARSIDPDFAFWDENFSITNKSREEGYNAVFGYLWVDEHHPARMKAFCKRAAGEGFPIKFFATPESHNTPRAAARPGGITYAKWALVVNAFLPAVPFIHSGFELAETYPINTGLDFTASDLRKYPSDKLPLFSEHAYDWLNKHQFFDFVKRLLELRAKYRNAIMNPDPSSFLMLTVSSENVLAFGRSSDDPKYQLAIVTNPGYKKPEVTRVRLNTSKRKVVDLLSGRKLPVANNYISVKLRPGKCLVFEY